MIDAGADGSAVRDGVFIILVGGKCLQCWCWWWIYIYISVYYGYPGSALKFDWEYGVFGLITDAVVFSYLCLDIIQLMTSASIYIDLDRVPKYKVNSETLKQYGTDRDIWSIV